MQNHSPQKIVDLSNTVRSIEKPLFYTALAIDKHANRNVSFKAGFANYFSKLLVDSRKVDLSRKLREKFLVFFRYIFS